jgi:hypothetical protein
VWRLSFFNAGPEQCNLYTIQTQSLHWQLINAHARSVTRTELSQQSGTSELHIQGRRRRWWWRHLCVSGELRALVWCAVLVVGNMLNTNS